MATSPWRTLRGLVPGLGETAVYDFLNMQVSIPVHGMGITGSPTPAFTRNSANNFSLVSTGAGTTTSYFSATVPVPNFRSISRGAMLNSVTIHYKVATADCADLQVGLATQVFGESANTATAITFTYDTSNDTTAERKAQGNHTMVCTVTSPAVISTDKQFFVFEIQLDTLNTSVVTINGITADVSILLP